MRGEVSWTDKRAATTLDLWREILPYYQQGAGGRSWQDAAQSLLDKKSGMAVIGLFLGQQITDEALRADIDFFPFPEIDPAYGQDTVEAPTDGFMLSRRPKNEKGAEEAAGVPRQRRGGEPLHGRRPEQRRRQRPGRHRFRTTRCRRSPPNSSPRPSTSPSSSTATATPASSPRWCCPGCTEVARPPRRRLGPAQAHRVASAPASSPPDRTGKVHRALRVARRAPSVPPVRPAAPPPRRPPAAAGSARGDRLFLAVMVGVPLARLHWSSSG